MSTGALPRDRIDLALHRANAAEERTDRWSVEYRHSAGRLGSRFRTAVRDEGRFLGWRAGVQPRVTVPPCETQGDGEWVEIGPGADLVALAPPDWCDRASSADGSVVGLVVLDGADTAMLARVVLAGRPEEVRLPVRLVARFAIERRGLATDYWFETVK